MNRQLPAFSLCLAAGLLGLACEPAATAPLSSPSPALEFRSSECATFQTSSINIAYKNKGYIDDYTGDPWDVGRSVHAANLEWQEAFYSGVHQQAQEVAKAVFLASPRQAAASCPEACAELDLDWTSELCTGETDVLVAEDTATFSQAYNEMAMVTVDVEGTVEVGCACS